MRLKPAALTPARRLHYTIEEVLRLAGSPAPATRIVSDRPVVQLLGKTEQRWHGLFAQDGRHLDCAIQDAPADVPVPGAPVAEILGILLENARTHGQGSVRVAVRDLDDALAFGVSDEGALEIDRTLLFARGHTGHGNGGGTGIGLSLARDLAVSLGGRVFLASPRPTTFSLLLPLHREPPER